MSFCETVIELSSPWSVGDVRAVREAVAAGDLAQADEAYRLAAKQLDRAGARRAIHPNTASRYKSRLQRLIKAAK